MRNLTILALLAAGSIPMFAQSAPVKMGLWDKKITMDNGDGAPSHLHSKSCVTPEVWQEMMANMNKKRDGCTTDNQRTGHGYTFTATCKMASGGTMEIAGSTTIVDSEHIVSKTHTVSTMNGQKKVADSSSTSTYLGASCGKITPDDPEIEND